MPKLTLSDLRSFFARRTSPDAITQGELHEIRARLSTTERELEMTKSELLRLASFEGINIATETLGAKSLKNSQNYNYLGQRFADYELSLLNIKQMGYLLGRLEAERSGFLNKEVAAGLPNNTRLKSKLCTQADCEEGWYRFWLNELCSGFVYHRKLWEFAYIAQSLFAHGLLNDGRRGLGFGCGEEPLASLFAKYGASVTATDLDPEASDDQGQGWIQAGAHGSSLARVLNTSVCNDPAKLANISHEFADMNAIPDHFSGQFDFCWSSCALEHIGSLELGLSFIENSMKTLKPGGVAVHTTEYNLDDGETIDHAMTVLFQRRHIEQLRDRLTRKGYVLADLDLDAGGGVMDGLFDLPPWPWDEVKLAWRMQPNFMHLKRSIGGFPCTSVALTIAKPH